MSKRIRWLIVLVILLVGCSAPVKNSLQTSTQPTAASVEVSDALRRDAETMAED